MSFNNDTLPIIKERVLDPIIEEDDLVNPPPLDSVDSSSEDSSSDEDSTANATANGKNFDVLFIFNF